jgi:serine/threonine protein kinase
MNTSNSVTVFSPFIYVSTIQKEQITKTQCFNLGNEKNELSNYETYITNLLKDNSKFIVYGVQDRKVVSLFATHDDLSTIVDSININTLKLCNLENYGSGTFGTVKQNAKHYGFVVKTPVDYWSPLKKAMARAAIQKEHLKLMLLNRLDDQVRDKYTLLLPTYNESVENGNSPRINFKQCKGNNLLDVISKLNQTDNQNQSERLNLAMQTTDALLYVCNELCKLQFAHCDVKPNNLMVCENVVKVIDFGNISKDQFACDGTPMFYPQNALVFINFINQSKESKVKLFVSPKTMQLLQDVASSPNYKGAASSIFTKDLYAIGLTLAIVYPYDDNDVINQMVDYLICQEKHKEFTTSNNPMQIAIKKWNHLKTQIIENKDGGRMKPMYTMYNKRRYRVRSGTRNALFITVGTKKMYLSSIIKKTNTAF